MTITQETNDQNIVQNKKKLIQIFMVLYYSKLILQVSKFEKSDLEQCCICNDIWKQITMDEFLRFFL
jgi:hypothetical protein